MNNNEDFSYFILIYLQFSIFENFEVFSPFHSKLALKSTIPSILNYSYYEYSEDRACVNTSKTSDHLLT